MAREQRKLAAILAADVVGYSRLIDAVSVAAGSGVHTPILVVTGQTVLAGPATLMVVVTGRATLPGTATPVT